MIPFDIEYLRPSSVTEAAEAWRQASDAGRSVRWFGGGTELVTGARDGTVAYDVVIDLKRIPETRVLDLDEGRFGAALRLTEVVESGGASGGPAYPLLAAAARGVADRTVRNSITLGGNLCGMLPYREAALPLLLFDATVVLHGPGGERRAAMGSVWDKRLRLLPGEFLVSVELPPVAREPGFYRRRTREPRVDYPLVTLCMARVDGAVRFAVGGVYGYPVRSHAAASATAEAAVAAIPDRIWNDLRGSAEYRRALLVQSLAEGLEAL